MLPPKKRSPATYSVPGLVNLLNLRSLEILFKEPAALCIPVATVGNEITSRPAIGCAHGIISPGQQDERLSQAEKEALAIEAQRRTALNSDNLQFHAGWIRKHAIRFDVRAYRRAQNEA
jgi:hypothetical protein